MGLFGKFRRGKGNQIDLDERSPKLGVKYRDLILMNEIAKQATDLSAPRHVLFYLFAPAKELGDLLASEARRRGFEATVREPSPDDCPDDSGSWSIVCETHTVLSADFVRDSVDFFEALADRHKAEYDGWEAAA